MIEFTHGDLLAAQTEAVVNPVNCVGRMGRGLAAQFRRAYPSNFKAYESACNRGEVRPGVMFVFETGLLTLPRWIINFPTKRHWREPSRMEDIDSGLRALRSEVGERGIRSISIPALGCGLGGLDWLVVREQILSTFLDMTHIQVIIFEPGPDG